MKTKIHPPAQPGADSALFPMTIPGTRILPNSDLPPMGMRVRLKANYDISSFPAEVQVILVALKKYGMLVADNGSAWYISGAPDSRWNEDNLHALQRVKGRDFEVVQMDTVVTD